MKKTTPIEGVTLAILFILPIFLYCSFLSVTFRYHFLVSYKRAITVYKSSHKKD